MRVQTAQPGIGRVLAGEKQPLDLIATQHTMAVHRTDEGDIAWGQAHRWRGWFAWDIGHAASLAYA